MDNMNAMKPEHTNAHLGRLIEPQERGAAPDLDVSLTDLDELENGELDQWISKNAVSTCQAAITACAG